MGKGIREFKKSITDVDKSLREPERDVVRSDRDYHADRLASGEPTPRRDDDESRPEPKRLLQ
jgi:Sec-independent protein translocase protein TatA